MNGQTDGPPENTMPLVAYYWRRTGEGITNEPQLYIVLMYASIIVG